MRFWTGPGVAVVTSLNCHARAIGWGMVVVFTGAGRRFGSFFIVLRRTV